MAKSYADYDVVLNRENFAEILERTDPDEMGNAPEDARRKACLHGAEAAFAHVEVIRDKVSRPSELALQFLKAGVEARNAYLKANA